MFSTRFVDLDLTRGLTTSCVPELRWQLALAHRVWLPKIIFQNCLCLTTKPLPFPVFRRVFEKLVNNRIVGHLEKRIFLSYFQYGIRSSRSTADLLAVVSDRIVRAFNKYGATQVVALDISKAFDRVWHAGLKSDGISGQIFGLISSFLSKFTTS